MTLLQTQLDDFFASIEDAIVCDKSTTNFIASLKPLPHEIDTLPWRFRVLGFIEAMVVTKKMTLTNFEHYLATLFGSHINDAKLRAGDSKFFAIKVVTDNGMEIFDVSAVNHFDAYFKLTQRVEYRELTAITSVEVFKGKAQNIDDSFNEPIKIFYADELIHLELADLAVTQSYAIQ